MLFTATHAVILDPPYVEEEADKDLKNSLIFFTPALFNILRALIKFRSKKAPSAPTIEIGNGRTNAMAIPIAM
jgi:hypothetical protein